MKMRTRRRTTVIATVTAAMMIAGAAMALAGLGGALIVLPTEPADREAASFDFRFGDDMFRVRAAGFAPEEPPCEDVETYRLWEVESDGIGELVIDGVDVTLEDADPWEGRFSLTDVPGGWYYFEAVCQGNGDRNGDFNDLLQNGEENGDIEPGLYGGELGFARLLVEVKVEGDVPEGTTFEVEVECWGPDPSVEPVLLVGNGTDNDGDPTFTASRTFEATGDTEQVVLYQAGNEPERLQPSDFEPTVGDIPAECTVTQTDDGGAESTTSDPAANSPVTIDIEELDDYTVTFTNTFPTEVEEEEEEPVEVDDEAEPAEPVEEEPDFTG